MPNSDQPFRQRVINRERMFGTFLKTPTVHAAEILAQEGYAFVVIDEEHSPFNPESTDRILAACRAAGIAGVVRVADTGQILRVLDCGASGVMVPHVDSADRAREVVAMARYRGGSRGFSTTTRAGGWGSKAMEAHINGQDSGVAVLAMIEDPHAVEHIDAIAAVDGIDAFFIGRGDLTVAYKAPNAAAPDVRRAVDVISASARKVGRTVFVLSGTAEDAVEMGSKGASGFLMSTDHGFLRQGARSTLVSYTKALDGG